MTTFADPVATDFVRDQWGRPLIIPVGGGKPVPYTRFSSAAKTVEDTYNIQKWDRRNRAYGMAHDSSLVARILALGGHPSTWDQATQAKANEISDLAADVALAHKAADIGSAVHRMTEIVDRGQPLIAGPYEADIEAYVNALIAAGFEVDPLYIECRLVCDELQMAGSADRFLTRSSDRMRFVADLKTGESVDYGGLGWGAQLAGYSHGLLYDVDKGERLPTPAIDKTTGLIIHLPAGKGICTLYEIDLVAGYRAAELANEIRAVRREARRWISPLVTAAPVDDSRARHPSTQPVPAMFAANIDLDEGDTIDDERYDKVKSRHDALPAEAQFWAGTIAAEANKAGVGFYLTKRPTYRRYWIYAGLIILAEDEVTDHDDVRALVLRATGRQPANNVGKTVGSMGVDEARAFCDACADLRAGRLVADYSDGPLRFIPAP